MDMSNRPPDVAPAITDMSESGIPAGQDVGGLPQIDVTILADHVKNARIEVSVDPYEVSIDITAPVERRPDSALEETARSAGIAVLEETAGVDVADDDMQDTAEAEIGSEAADQAEALAVRGDPCKEADSVTERAAAMGIALPPEMARRAGEILTNTRVVDPEAAAARYQRARSARPLVVAEPPDASAEPDSSETATADVPPPIKPPDDPPVPADNGGDGNEGDSSGDDARTAGEGTDVLGGELKAPSVTESLSAKFEKQNISRGDLAQQAGVSLEAVDNLLDGTEHPNIPRVLIPVMQALGVEHNEGLGLIDRYRAEIDPAQLPQPGALKSDTSDLIGFPSGKPQAEKAANGTQGSIKSGKTSVARNTPEPTRPQAPVDTVASAFNIAQRVSGLTVPELAGRMGADLSELTRFFNGTHHPDAQFVEKMGRELGMLPERIRSELERYQNER